MEQPADFTFKDTERGRTAVLTGDWTAVFMGEANERLQEELRDKPNTPVDLTGVGRCDTSGAYGIIKASGASGQLTQLIARPEVVRLLELVDRAIQAEPTPEFKQRHFMLELFERIGRGVVGLGDEVYSTFAFIGHLLVAIGRAIKAPHKIRLAACFAQAEKAGLDALPIVCLTNFFIGAVVGYLGASLLTQFNAQVLDVDLIGVAVLREFNALITAVLVAGRSGSAFAAEIGSMKMKQEIDAMQVLGVDPFDALVFPRFWGLFWTMPLLTFAATISGLAGGMVVVWSELGLSPTFFAQRLIDDVGAKNFWIGMSKAPVLAVVIAGIGSRQGMLVGGDVDSLGRRVTAAVVHAIFATITIDAVFAVLYMKLKV